MAALLPKSLISRLSALTGLGSAPVQENRAGEGQKEAPEVKDSSASSTDDNDAAAAAAAASSPSQQPPPPPPLSSLDDSALTLALDNLPPRDLAALSLASQRFSGVAAAGDAWRLRFAPRLPTEVVERLDGAAEEESLLFRGKGEEEEEGGKTAAASPPSPLPSFGWPSTYAALALSNLLRSPLEWEGVAMGMRAAATTTAASEASASSPAWRVTCHGGHGWEVEREGPAGSEEVPVAVASEEKRWPAALMPRSALAASRGASLSSSSSSSTSAAAAAALSSWLSRSLLLPSPPPPSQRPLSVAASFSWCEIVQEVDLVFELLRATSWVSSLGAGGAGGGGGGGEEKEAKTKNGDDSDDGGDDDDDDDDESGKGKAAPRKKSTSSSSIRNLCWTRRDAEAYLDSSPHLVLSFFAVSRKDCESCLSASLLALADLKETGPLPPYHGRANYDWKGRTQALASSDLPERAAPWEGQDGSSKAGKWERLTLQPLELPKGTRRALVVLRSKDSRFWSGHYGAKLAAPVLAFAATGAELEDAEKAAEETERGAEAAATGRELLFAA